MISLDNDLLIKLNYFARQQKHGRRPQRALSPNIRPEKFGPGQRRRWIGSGVLINQRQHGIDHRWIRQAVRLQTFATFQGRDAHSNDQLTKLGDQATLQLLVGFTFVNLFQM